MMWSGPVQILTCPTLGPLLVSWMGFRRSWALETIFLGTVLVLVPWIREVCDARAGVR